MKRFVLLLLLCGAAAWAQTAAEGQTAGQTTPTLRLGTTLVQVPVSVRTRSGEPVFTLEAKDFLVTDDGVEQKVRLEDESGSLPLALVVVVEAGDTPDFKFKDYEGLGRMMDLLASGAEHRVAVVGFDSQPAVVQPFTADSDVASASLAKIETGDGGAASLDALEMAVGLLRQQPLSYRRAILLVSETVDRGSQTTLARALRAVSDTNTVIYSLGYSSTRATTKHEAGNALGSSQAGPPHGCMGKEAEFDLEGNPVAPPENAKAQGSHQGGGAGKEALKAYDCLVTLAPPLVLAKIAVLAAINGFRTNVPEAAARITGGEYFKAENSKTLEKDLLAISNRLPNRYFLSFTPTASHPGLHAIAVALREPREGVKVQARSSYWEDAPLVSRPQ